MKDFESLKHYLDKLEEDSLDEYLRICYNVLISSPLDVLQNEADENLKAEGLNKLIHYFESRDEFEKCVELKKIKDLL
tara:strand:- start:1753 stop:1986 length:234 start_codon:yes stop_codon:yes gene_type:complete